MSASLAEETEEGEVAEPDQPTDDAQRPSRWARNAWAWVSAALVLVGGAVGSYGFSKYETLHEQQAAAQRQEADRATATRLARDYTMKSLTYSYQDPDSFFRGVEDGVSPALKNKYVNATDLLKAIMLQAQVTSSGEVLSTETQALPGDVFQTVATASQTIRNLQNPEPRTSTLVLQITVNKSGDIWQVSDIGPKVRNGQGAAPQLPAAPTAVPPARGTR